MDEGIFYLVAAYVVVSTILQVLLLTTLREIGRRLGAIGVGQERVIALLEAQDELDIEVELEENDTREYAQSA